MRRRSLFLVALFLFCSALLRATDPPQILTNHLGYDTTSPKRAVIRGSEGEQFESFVVKTYPAETLVFKGKASAVGAVDQWRDWRFWTLDFNDLSAEGTYFIESSLKDRVIRSFPFKIQKHILERHTLSDVLYYFKSERCSGALDRADRKLPRPGSENGTVDVHGGWYDASGDYGVHMSHLDFSGYFNPQQVPLVVVSLAKTLDLLGARVDGNFTQIKRRLVDEITYGADFLVRMKTPKGSFYETIGGPGPEKKAEDRRLGQVMSKGFNINMKKPTGDSFKKQADGESDGVYEVGFRNGGGFAIAGLAMAARCPMGGDFSTATYLKTAETAFAFLETHNSELIGSTENIVDDYCALMAAAELFRTTKNAKYNAAAKRRAESLLGRLVTSGSYKDYWRADDQDRPFFHAADAGAPVVSLMEYYDLADKALQVRIKEVVRRSLECELRITDEVANPFGLARQYIQNKSGQRRSSFFYPHDSDTAPWWQGENARLASLSAAARLAAPIFASDPIFQTKLQTYAADQLNWILGLNPFDACMLQGTGRNNPEYVFFSSWEYKSAPGGICNGITSGYKDDQGIDLNVPYEISGQDSDWRWAEQWLPHTSWYILAVAAGKTTAPSEKAIIGYIFCPDKLLKAEDVAAEKLTHINYAFANIQDGQVVEGFKYDAENYKVLNGLKARNHNLKVLVSVGGWTWSGGFSDAALTVDSRKKFIDSAVAFVQRHELDGFDVDWEYPGQKGLNNINRPEDKENCTALMAGLRAALDEAGKSTGKHYLLTMATGADDGWLAHTEMDKVQASLDFMNLMAYDQFEAESDPIAAHHAPLFTHPANPKDISASTIINHYIAAGVPPSKIALGVPFYGHSWGKVPATEHGLYQSGKEPTERLHTSFKNIKDKLENKGGFVRYWDDISKAPFLYNAETQLFISYEDEQSVGLKSRYVVDKGLAGIMFWEYREDGDGKLLDAVNAGLQRKK